MTKQKNIAVAVVERGDAVLGEEVLIGQRPDGVPLAGYWEFPGGKVETDETFEDAAVRECWEETGLRVTVTGEFSPVTHAYEHATVVIRFFRCRLSDGQTAVDRDLKGSFRWVDRKSLGEYQFPEANDALLQELLAS